MAFLDLKNKIAHVEVNENEKTSQNFHDNIPRAIVL